MEAFKKLGQGQTMLDQLLGKCGLRKHKALQNKQNDRTYNIPFKNNPECKWSQLLNQKTRMEN